MFLDLEHTTAAQAIITCFRNCKKNHSQITNLARVHRFFAQATGNN